MERRRFMLFSSGLHMLFGVYFLFFSSHAVAVVIKHPNPSSAELVKGLSGFILAFGMLNFMGRKSEDPVALRAILFATGFYLAITAAFDAYWTWSGLLTTMAWCTIVVRVALAAAYGRYFLALASR